MEQQQNTPNSPENRRKRPPSPMRIFKETYLPIIILGVSALLIFVFILSALVRGVQGFQYRRQLALEASIAAQQAQEELDAEADSLIRQATALASHYDYERAMACLEGFSGDMADYPEMQERYDTYSVAFSDLVLWDDPSSVINLSFHQLIADPSRAYTNGDYGSSYNKNYITVDEFRAILQQLYENDYILVSLSDIADSNGPCELYLPAGKTPFILTETNANYYLYMVDGDGDKVPDQNGAGFAHRLIEDANGNITCEMITSDGQTVTGAYDIIPILESFIETHPDFSYKGARAIIAMSGYDGILGYRTNAEARERLSEDAFLEEMDSAAYIVERLENMGYEIACYTYGNEPYGNISNDQVQQDLQKWSDEVSSISYALAETDIFVFAQLSDIAAANEPYTGEKLSMLQEYGFGRFIGFSAGSDGWFYTGNGYIRQGRLLVTGTNLAHHAMWFEGMFDAASILDPARGEVPA